MKKFYAKPELEVTELLCDDILTSSNDDTGDETENEVLLNGDSLFK